MLSLWPLARSNSGTSSISASLQEVVLITAISAPRAAADTRLMTITPAAAIADRRMVLDVYPRSPHQHLALEHPALRAVERPLLRVPLPFQLAHRRGHGQHAGRHRDADLGLGILRGAGRLVDDAAFQPRGDRHAQRARQR